jgi:hypothetical protein
MTKVVNYSFDSAEFDEMRADLIWEAMTGMVYFNQNQLMHSGRQSLKKAKPMKTYNPHKSFTNNN